MNKKKGATPLHEYIEASHYWAQESNKLLQQLVDRNSNTDALQQETNKLLAVLAEDAKLSRVALQQLVNAARSGSSAVPPRAPPVPDAPPSPPTLIGEFGMFLETSRPQFGARSHSEPSHSG